MWQNHQGGHLCQWGKTERNTGLGGKKSLTMYKKAIIATSIINECKKCDVGIENIPEKFIIYGMNETSIVVISGTVEELMVKTSPEIYSKYIIVDNDNCSVVYVILQRALYGCMCSEFIVYKHLLTNLDSVGFEVNTYDSCVEKHMVNRKQYTIMWTVNYLKLSHIDTKEVTKVTKWTKGVYVEDMWILWGNKNEHLRKELDLSNPREVKTLMVKYLKGVIENFREFITGSSPSPSSGYLFNARLDE